MMCAMFLLAAVQAANMPAVPQGYTPVLTTDFAAQPEHWGSVTIVDGALAVDGETLVPVSRSRDFVVDYRARVKGRGILNLRFHYDLDSGNFYMFRLDTRSATGDPPGFLKSDMTSKLWHLCGKRLTTSRPAPDTWVDVRVEAKGSHFEAYVDGKLVATLEDADYGEGFLSLKSEVTSAEVAWIRVSAPAGSDVRPLGLKPPSARRVEPYSEGRWTADWIWSPGPDDSLVRYFRKAFDVPARAGQATLAITCDNRYAVWLNGKRVGADSEWQSVEAYEVASLLRKGRNVLAVRCANDAPGAAGLLAELEVNGLDGNYTEIPTDATWRAVIKAPAGWEKPGFDDSAWGRATSLGKFPQPPWSGQSPLTVPYLGPRQALKLTSLRVPSRVRVNQAFDVEASFVAPQRLKHNYLLEVLVGAPGVPPQPLALVKPHTPATAWPVGTPHRERLQVTLRPDVGYLLGDRTCDLQVRMLGTFLMPPKPKAAHLAVAPGGGLRFVGYRRPSPDGRPVTSGVLRDAAGGRHPWNLADDGAIVIDGQPYAVLPQSDGVYYCRLDAATRKKLAELDWPGAGRRLCAEGGPVPEDVVRVGLTDAVDCAKTDHEYSEDGGLGGESRVLEIEGRRYRVTASRNRLSYFAYTMTCQAPRNPHLLLFQTVNDRERYTTVRIQPPWDNVGGGVYTGREYPCDPPGQDGRPIDCMFLFYPRKKAVRLTVSSWPCYEKRTPMSGAAVSGLWLFELEDAPADRPITVLAPRGQQRRLGMYLTHPLYCYQLYGFDGHDDATRLASLRSFRDYLRFCGLNLFEYNAVDGGDTTKMAYYPSSLWPAEPGDLTRDILKLLPPDGFQVVPIITSLSVPEGKFGFTRDSFQIDRYGHPTVFFGSRPPLPDPLRPEVQRVLKDNLREILDICGRNPAVPAVGVRVNGKIGLCYGGDQLGSSDQYTGYSDWDVEQFRKATGIQVPQNLKPTAYDWIHAHCWQQWLDWRCRATAKLWRSAADLVRSYRPNLLLMASCDMPSETPAWNIYWPSGISPHECMVYHGFDPDLLRDMPGLLLQRGMMIAADRYFTYSGQYGENHWALKAFHYAPGTAEMYAGPAGAWCELYYNYWEESGLFAQGEFHTSFWGAATMQPWGRYFFEPMAFSLAATNAQAINLFSWERGTFAHEYDLRSFARAYRALPTSPGEDAGRYVRLVSPQRLEASGESASAKPQPPTAPEGKGLWTRWFGDRLAVCNFSPQTVTVEVTWPKVLQRGRMLVEASKLSVLASGSTQTPSVRLTLRPYELKTIVNVAEQPAP